jgi:AAHS family 4-hydroxybenzoate transporter-like MFS transporter
MVVLAGGIASPALLMTAIIVAGAFITGAQTAINGATSVTYPADRRAAGLGWAFGIGRLGSIAGPLVGSAASLLGMVEPRQFFLLPLVPLGLAAAAALCVHRLLSVRT